MSKPVQPDQDRRHYVFFTRPRCPRCNSVRLRAYKTMQNGDGSLTRYSRCQTCGARLLIVVN